MTRQQATCALLYSQQEFSKKDIYHDFFEHFKSEMKKELGETQTLHV